MGLDQYLTARRATNPDTIKPLLREPLRDYDGDYGNYYLSMWEHTDGTERAAAIAVIEAAGLERLRCDESPSGGADADGAHVDVTTIYWRKANAVHAWFVDHCQDGDDDCGEYPVHVEQLAALASACEQAYDAWVLGDLERAAEIMPPRSGFFFGSTELDEWWAEDMKHTIAEIKRVVSTAIEIGGIEFFYKSSW